MMKTSFLFRGVLALVGLAACGPSEPPPSTPPPPPTSSVAPSAPAVTASAPVAAMPEPPPPPALPPVELVEGAHGEAPEKMPTVKFKGPAQAQVISVDKKGDYEVKLDVKDWPAPEGGRHVHLIVDNQPYKRIDDPKQPIKLKDIVPGYELAENQQHFLIAFASRPTHESIKALDKKGTPMSIVGFFVGKKGEERWKAKDPLLVFSRPKGKNNGPPPAEGILVDFYLVNAELGDGKFSVKATLKGPGAEEGKSVTIKSWKPWRIKNPRTGTYSLQLTLQDKDSKPVPGPWNDVTQSFQVDLEAPADAPHHHPMPGGDAKTDGKGPPPASSGKAPPPAKGEPKKLDPGRGEGTMSGSLIAGGLFGWTLVFLGLMVFFGLVWVRRRGQVESLLLSVFALSSAVHTTGSGYFYQQATSAGWQSAWVWAAGLTVGSSIVNMPLLVHFGLRVSGLRWRPVLVGFYALAAFYLLVLVGGGWWHGLPQAVVWLPLWGGHAPVVHTTPTSVALSCYALGVGVLGVLCYLLGRGVMAGDQALRPSLMASLVLAGLGLHDIYRGSTEGNVGLSVVPLGYLIFLFGVCLTLVTRYTRLSEDLERSSQHLAQRSDELRRSYEALQQAQGELVKREQLAVVGELAAVIAHEVRNPLAVITNAVAGLKRRETSPDDHATLLSIISEESHRLNRLVSDLLSYARPVSPQRQTIAVGEFVERSVLLQLSIAPGVSASFTCDPTCPPVAFDPGLMRRVLDNVVGNAVQAMHQQGVLIVRVSTSEQDGVRGVLIEIQDDGEGMDTQVRTQAMTPFFTTRPSGTGLGLAIVDRIIEAHGGSMSLDSRPGVGTTVRLFLPGS